MVYLFLAEGFEDIEAITVIDILRRADVRVRTVSVTDSKMVISAHDIPVQADMLMGEVDLHAADMLVLPGGMPGTRNLAKSEQLIELLKEAYKMDKYLAAICAAPTVLSLAGVLMGRRAICYPGFERDIENAILVNEPVVKDGKLITSKGAGTAMLFAFALVEILKGQLESESLTKGMIFDWWTLK